jgi:uncharacterized membrane protein YqjE
MNMQNRQRESAMLVMVAVATSAVMLALLAIAGAWFLRKRRTRALSAAALELDALTGSPPAEA